MNLVAYIAAVVLFLLAALGYHPFGNTQSDLIAFGLAFFALAHILPPR